MDEVIMTFTLYFLMLCAIQLALDFTTLSEIEPSSVWMCSSESSQTVNVRNRQVSLSPEDGTSLPSAGRQVEPEAGTLELTMLPPFYPFLSAERFSCPWVYIVGNVHFLGYSHVMEVVHTKRYPSSSPFLSLPPSLSLFVPPSLSLLFWSSALC